MEMFILYLDINKMNYMTVEYITKYLEKSLAYIHYMPRFYPIYFKN